MKHHYKFLKAIFPWEVFVQNVSNYSSFEPNEILAS